MSFDNMAGANERWWNEPELWVEVFAILTSAS
jgi:hypothetical protein